MSDLPLSITDGSSLEVITDSVSKASSVTPLHYPERRGTVFRWGQAHRGVTSRSLPHEMSDAVPDDLLLCTLCGRPLGESSDDQPDWPTGPMCGDCYQAREMDNDIWAAELDESTGDEDGL
jgi:hypothetical protein